MEGDEMEMTKKELQRWIRRQVQTNQLIAELTEKRNLLRSLLTNGGNRANRLQRLSRLLASCEALVKRNYSLLGWEYQYTCSDDEMSTSESEFPSTHETPDHGISSANRLTPSSQKPADSPNPCTVNEETFQIDLNRQPVVVLAPLSPRWISSSRSPLPKNSDPPNKECHNVKSESSREPDTDEESNSDSKIPNDDAHPKKRQKITEDMEHEDHASQEREKSSTNTITDFDEANTNTLAESKPADVQDPPSNLDTEICMDMAGKVIELVRSESPSTCETPDHGFSSANRLTPSSQKPGDSPNPCPVNEETFHIDLNKQPVVVLAPLSPRLISLLLSALPKSSDPENNDCSNLESDSSWDPDTEEESNSDSPIPNDDAHPKKRQKITENMKHRATDTLAESKPTDVQDPPSNLDTEICIGMAVLAKNRSEIWQKGKVVDIVRNENGAPVYEVCFEDDRKDLVSGPHMAFGNSAQLDQLFVGSCVVVEHEGQVPRFCFGILVEVPTIKNKHRFLVFFDNHTPAYVTLASIHCLCEPLKNPLDNILDKMHKNFMQEYLNNWPYVPKVLYSVGQNIFATCNGFLQACEVLITDSSLIQVVFESTKHKEWIHRGSPRLEPIQKNKKLSKRGSQKSL